MSAAVTYRGTVHRSFWVNTESGWMAGVLRLDERDPDRGTDIRFAGSVAAAVGDQLEISGDWTPSKYGEQVTVTHANVLIDESPDALVRLIADRSEFKGVGPVRARQIVEAAQRLAPDGEFVTGLRDHFEAVAALVDVPREALAQLYDMWEERSAHYAGLAELVAQGWTSGQAARLLDTLGPLAAVTVRHNPYELIGKVARLGFKAVDAVARVMGMGTSDVRRLRAGIAYCLDQLGNDGHTWTSREGLVQDCMRELEPDTFAAQDAIGEELQDMIATGLVFMDEVDGQQIVADMRVANMEVEVFARLVMGLQTRKALAPEGNRTTSREFELTGSLNAGQRAALDGFRSFQFSVVSGGAGVGKTYLMDVVAKLADVDGIRIKLCAPTARAARKLAATTGRTATTLHALLEPEMTAHGFVFTRNADRPIAAEFVIIDEISMTDIRLMHALLSALPPDAHLLLVGDHNQIPSVAAGALLRDILSAKEQFPGAVHVLDLVVRQAGVLARNTHTVLDGVVVPTQDPAWGLCVTPKDDLPAIETAVNSFMAAVAYAPESPVIFDGNLDPIWDVQILSPTKNGPVGTHALNHQLQVMRQRKLGNTGASEIVHTPNKSNKALPGDKVMWTKNDRDLGLDNGTQAIVHRMKKGGIYVLLLDDGREVEIPTEKANRLTLAYVITFHKAQGSEWPYVIMIASSAHWFQHDRNLFYTGCGRASKSVTIIGDWPGMRNFASTQKSAVRRTFGSMCVKGWRPTIVDVMGRRV